MAGEADLQEAVFELHQYLSDRLAPLMVASSMELLLKLPVRVLAGEIWKWTEQQRIAAPQVPASDFLFHAVKKIAAMGEFELVPRESLGKYVSALGSSVLQYCPEAERELLRQSLERLGTAATAPTAVPVEMLHRQGDAATSKPDAPQPEAGSVLARGLRRLSLFLERLQPQAAAAASAEQRAETVSQAVAAAAVQSMTREELDQHLAALGNVGVPTEPEKVFRTLAGSLPGWGVLPTVAGQDPSPVSGTELDAMRRIVALSAEDPADAAKRFRELVHTAIEQFNEGHLGRAVAMFELAEVLVADRKVQPVFVDALRQGGHEYLDRDRLRKTAERTDTRTALRAILNFFQSLRPEGLLRDLDGETSRERRHQLLALLEVHGQPARAKALELLRASVQPGAQVDPFFQRNLVYLLVEIPRPADVSVEDEVNLVMSAPGRASPPPLVKQVIAYLAATRHDKAERALITYLRLFENMLLEPETATYEPHDVEVLLDRVCAALARFGSPRAWRALVDHGLRSEQRLGATLARLSEAGRQDLSSSRDVVERLVGALRSELPRSVMGFTLNKNEDRIASLIEALSGTPLPDVKAAFEEIAAKYPGEIGEAARKGLVALHAAGKPPEPPAGLSGDLELFGLPGVLQTLSQANLTGTLSLMNAGGKVEATVLFDKGRLRTAQCGSIRGEDAVYQLFERPFPGTFAFVSRSEGASDGSSAPRELLPLILEGVRRHDEFKRAAALVPDRSALKPTGQTSTPLPDEDEDFTRYIWGKAAAGTPATDCEASIATDSYRVRRLLAHWVEEGALTLSA